MKILLDNLKQYDVIDKLIIHSLDQALYRASVIINNEEYAVWENGKKTLLRKNLTQMRESFSEMPIKNTVLRHTSAYDEMIGLPKTENDTNVLEISLGNNVYTQPKRS